MRTGSSAVEHRAGQVLTALENRRFNWRTVESIAAELGMTGREVEQVLTAHPHIVVRASERDSKGRPLYTTREHYKRTHSLASRFFNAVTDRVA